MADLLKLGREVLADPTWTGFERQGRPITGVEMIAATAAKWPNNGPEWRRYLHRGCCGHSDECRAMTVTDEYADGTQRTRVSWLCPQFHRVCDRRRLERVLQLFARINNVDAD